MITHAAVAKYLLLTRKNRSVRVRKETAVAFPTPFPSCCIVCAEAACAEARYRGLAVDRDQKSTTTAQPFASALLSSCFLQYPLSFVYSWRAEPALMAFHKRSREEDLVIKTADGEPLQAEAYIVRACSSVARGLPADAEAWDVSGLLLGGQPFSRACSVLHGDAELSQDAYKQLFNAKQLYLLLAFCHAVGSTQGLLNVACSRVDNLQFRVQLPEQTIQLYSGMDNVYLFPTDNEDQLAHIDLKRDVCNVGKPCVSREQRRQLQQQVAAQVGSLLHMAHVLRQQQLIDTMHSFILWHTRNPWSLLWGVLELIFTDEAVAAALGSSTLSKVQYINSVLTQPCSFMDGFYCRRALMQPEGPFSLDSDTGSLQFQAKLLQDFAGGKEGDTVDVNLELFQGGGGMIISINHDHLWLPAQLMLGNTLGDGEDWYEVMQSNIP